MLSLLSSIAYANTVHNTSWFDIHFVTNDAIEGLE